MDRSVKPQVHLLQMNLRYALHKTTYGWIGAIGSDLGLRLTVMPKIRYDEVVEALGKEISIASLNKESFSNLFNKIELFMMGFHIEFHEQIDPTIGTPFLRQVWQATQAIPYGETRTYGFLAEKVGRPRAARAIGRAMATNRLPPIVPCHRVIGANGALCGYGCTGGIDLKRKLLTQESVAKESPPIDPSMRAMSSLDPSKEHGIFPRP